MDKQNFKNILNYIEKIAGAEELLQNGAYNELHNMVQQDMKNIDDITNKNRSLHIGIVGEVKAGKSSFLNALLFKGEDILPKAPTPMTAALTKLSYSKEAYAKVVYYTEGDWQVIEENEKAYQARIDRKLQELQKKWEDDEKKPRLSYTSKPKPTAADAEKRADFTPVEESCHQLVNLVKANDLENSKANYLGEEKILRGSDLLPQLEDYVGSKGRLTPLVKYTEVYLDKEELKDIVIIDTPGLNDPITSRSTLTKEFLTNCDVVFLLSYVGQFFGQGDIDFLRKEIANASIKKAVLIGSKLDSGIADYPKPRASFVEAYNGSIVNYNKQARTNLEEALKYGKQIPVLKKLLEENNIYYISGLAYQVAINMEENKPIGEAGELMLNNLARFTGFKGYDPKFIKKFSGINKIKRDVLKKAKEEKDKILGERIEDFAKDRIVEYLKATDVLTGSLYNNMLLLQNNDVAQLQQRKQDIIKALNKARIRISSVFENEAVNVQKYINDIKGDIQNNSRDVKDVEVTTTTRTKREKEGGFLGFWQDTVYYEIKEDHAIPSDAIGSVQNFAYEAEALINSKFNNLFDIERIKVELGDEIANIIQFTDGSIDANDILTPIKTALNQLTLSNIKVDPKPFKERITNAFPGNKVMGDSILELQGLHKEVIFEMVAYIGGLLEKKGVEIAQLLKRRGSTITDEIEGKCSRNLDSLAAQIKDKDKAFADHEAMINMVKAVKGEIAQLQ